MYHASMKTTQLMPHTESTVFEFLETASRLERRLDRALSIRGISFSEFRLLKSLMATEAIGCSRIELATAVGLTPSAVTRALKPLDKLGYVTTSRNVRDARQSLATITAAGEQLFEDAQGAMRDLFVSLPFNGLSRQKITEFQTRLPDLQ